MSNFPKVFMDANRRSCMVIGEDLAGYEVVQMADEGLALQTLSHDAFEANWTASDYPVNQAATRYLGFAETHPSNNARAIEWLKAYLQSLAVEPVAGDDVVKAKNETLTPEIKSIEAGAPSDTPSPSLEVEVPSDPLPVMPPAEIAPTQITNPKEVVMQEAATIAQEQQSSAATATDELEQSYAVHVNGQSVSIQMGKARDNRLAPEAYGERPQTIATAPVEPLFYVAFDDNGVLARVASVNPLDRKVIGALTGGWIAEGFTVTKASLKELARHVTAARKVFEPKEKKTEAGNDPALSDISAAA
jgi:hypothetical protein